MLSSKLLRKILQPGGHDTSWAAGYYCFANVHAVIEAGRSSVVEQALLDAESALPDGAPVAWLCRILSGKPVQRVSGPDTMSRILKEAEVRGEGVYFYGSTPETLNRLQWVLTMRFPALRVLGFHSPAFRPLGVLEKPEVLDAMASQRPRYVFVGLGCPKQEVWMRNHAHLLPGASIFGVGAAFDFEAGVLRRAPVWVQAWGLEWLHRLWQEPGRLWKRYLVTNSLFVWYAIVLIVHHRILGRPFGHEASGSA